MSATRIHLAVIIGSNREGRFGGVVGHWLAAQAAQRDDMIIDVIDLVDVDLPIVLPRRATPSVQAYLERLERADAFVVVTPEYNHGYPAGLKQAIDLAHTQWRAKPVGFVSYGGMAGGLRAVEQLRQVFAELHTMTVRETVSFHNVWPLFHDTTGEPLDPSGCNAAATVMLDEIAWWATALRAARRDETARNRDAFRRFYEEAVSKGDLDVIDDVVHPDVVHHSAHAGQEPGAPGLKATAAMLRETFAGFTMTAHDVIAEGDNVAGRFAVSGVHTGEPFEFEEIMIARFDDGQIVEIWNHSEPLPFAERD